MILYFQLFKLYFLQFIISCTSRRSAADYVLLLCVVLAVHVIISCQQKVAKSLNRFWWNFCRGRPWPKYQSIGFWWQSGFFCGSWIIFRDFFKNWQTGSSPDGSSKLPMKSDSGGRAFRPAELISLSVYDIFSLICNWRYAIKSL